jgi:hypothetical protein
MTLRAIVYGLSLKNLTASWVVGDVTKTCVNPWQYLPVNLGAFLNAGGPMAALCGTVGATDIVNFLVGAPLNLRMELHEWYSNTMLPTKDWDSYAGTELLVQTVSESVACHISRSQWDNAYLRYRAENGLEDTPYDEKRCGRLHSDMARKCLQLLNDWKAGVVFAAWVPDDNYAKCYDCHFTDLKTPTYQVGWVRNGKEDCTICHDVPPYHPRTKGKK